MRTEQLYYALMVAEKGSFSQAAEQLFIKQQSVRVAINNLEKELNVTLFARTSKGVRLTAEGKKCLDKFTEILAIYDELKGDAPKTEPTCIRLGISEHSDECIYRILKEFATQAPHVQLKILEQPPLTSYT